MSGSNQFKAIATGLGANALTPAAYAALTVLLANGYQTGTANSTYINTTLRQSSFVAAAIAQAIADSTGAAVNDDGVIANFEAQFLAMLQQENYMLAHAAGTSDAVTAAFVPAITTLVDGQTFSVRVATANTTTTPTFTPNAGTIAPAAIVKLNGVALMPGDLAGAGHWCDFQWDAGLTKWVLLNPASSASAGATGGGTDQLFYLNKTTMTTSYVLPAGKNASMVGPLTINSGVTLTVPTGQRAVIL